MTLDHVSVPTRPIRSPKTNATPAPIAHPKQYIADRSPSIVGPGNPSISRKRSPERMPPSKPWSYPNSRKSTPEHTNIKVVSVVPRSFDLDILKRSREKYRDWGVSVGRPAGALLFYTLYDECCAVAVVCSRAGSRRSTQPRPVSASPSFPTTLVVLRLRRSTCAWPRPQGFGRQIRRRDIRLAQASLEPREADAGMDVGARNLDSALGGIHRW